MISANELYASLASRYGDNGLSAVLARLKEKYDDVSKQSIRALFIDNIEDWTQYKRTVFDVRPIEEFLQNNIVYGTKFLKIIQTYKKDIENKLKAPEDFDEETTVSVVEKLKEIIERRFTGLLTACYRGINGDVNDIAEKKFLGELVVQIEKYMRHIGFNKMDVREGDDYNKLIDMLEVIVYKPTDSYALHGKIQEIETPPYGINYINEDNETDTCYVNGRCIVWRIENENHS